MVLPSADKDATVAWLSLSTPSNWASALGSKTADCRLSLPIFENVPSIAALLVSTLSIDTLSADGSTPSRAVTCALIGVTSWLPAVSWPCMSKAMLIWSPVKETCPPPIDGAWSIGWETLVVSDNSMSFPTLTASISMRSTSSVPWTPTIELEAESYVKVTGWPLEVMSLLSSLRSESRERVSGAKESGSSAKLPATTVSVTVTDWG